MYKKLIFLISIVLLLSLPAAADNLLQNPGFETEGAGGAQDANVWVESGDAQREEWGDFSERGTGTWGIGIMDWGGPKDGDVYQDVDGITGDTLYNFDIWAKRDAGDVTGDFYLTLKWYLDGVHISDSYQAITLTNNWVEQSLIATSPGTANEVRVLFGQDTDQCGKWDDAYFGYPHSAARYPNPADDAEGVADDVILSWTPGYYVQDANGHQVYLGTNFNDVNDANTLDFEYKGNPTEPNYDTGILDLGQTYYWRIDEVNGATTWPGEVWSFTVTDQMLLNPGFEAGNAQDADVWVESGDAKREEWGDFSERGTGTWGIGIMDWGGPKDGDVYQDVDGIASSTQYQFDIWAKRDAGDPVVGDFYLTLKWYVDSVHISDSYQAITLTDGWTEQSLIATSPDTANEVRVLFGQDTDKCGKWDDAHFGQVRGVAHEPDPEDGEERVSEDEILSWSPGYYVQDVNGHEVYFGTDYNDVNDANTTVTLGVYKGAMDANSYDPCGLEFETTYYWRVDEVNGPNTWEGDVWSFTTIPPIAREPSPDNGSIMDNENEIISWLPGAYAASHDVYFGTDYWAIVDANTSDPNEYKGNQGPNSYDPGALSFDTTYYWRIDEVNGPNTWEGDVWSFDVRMNLLRNSSFEDNGGAGTHPDWWGSEEDDPGVQDWDDEGVPQAHSGSWLMAVQHWAGTGTGDFYQDNIAVSENTDYIYTMWAKRDGSAWVGTYNMTVEWYDDEAFLGESTLDITAGIGTEWSQFSLDATSMAGSDNASVMIEFVDVGTDWTNGCGMFDDASFSMVPQTAYKPIPGDETTGVASDVDLSWAPGRDVQTTNEHQVYFGTDYNDVNDANTVVTLGVYKGVVDVNSYDPGTLELGTTYYWRIDEVNSVDTWKGDIWSFTVRDYLVVDDFESYTTSDNLRLTWVPLNYSGNVLLEETDPNLIHGGAKSMMINYHEDYTHGAERTYGTAQDWTAFGVKALDLWFYGQTGNNANAQMYVKLEDASSNSATVVYGDSNDLKVEQWQIWHIDLQAFVDANSVNLAQVEKVAIGFIDPPTGEDADIVYFDDIRLYIPRCLSEEVAADFTGDCTIDYEDLVLMTDDWLLSDEIVGANAPSDANLVALYEFDGDLTDSSGNGYNGTEGPNTLTYAAGKVGPNSLNLDGDDDYVYIADSNVPDSPFDAADAVTLTAWVKASSSPDGWQSIITKGDSAWRLHRQSDEVEFACNGVQPGFIRAAGVGDGEWHHIAGVYDGSKLYLYVDGDLAASEEASGAINTNDYQVYIGENVQEAGRYWNGLLDEVRVYNCALSHGNIVSLAGMSEGYVPLPNPDIDICEDGKVDFKDYAVLAEDWLETVLWP